MFTGSKKNIPWDYTELVLCRDVYHCTPSELAQQNWEKITRHLGYLNIEAEVRDANENSNKNSAKNNPDLYQT